MFQISASVGRDGKNLTHDVAKLQAAFTAIKFEGKKYAVTGELGTFGDAIHRYIRANATTRMEAFPIFSAIQPTGTIMESIRKRLQGKAALKYEAVWDTPALFIPSSKKHAFIRWRDHLLPPYLQFPESISPSIHQTFDFFIEGDIFLSSPPQDFLYAYIGIEGIDAFVNPLSLQRTQRIPDSVMRMLKKQFDHTPWRVVGQKRAVANGSPTFIIKTLYATDLRDSLTKLGQFGRHARVFLKDNQEIRIPPKKEIFEVAGIVHAAACSLAGTGRTTGKPNRKVAKLAQNILKSHGLQDQMIARECMSCNDLAAQMLRHTNRIEEIDQQLEQSNHLFDQMLDDIKITEIAGKAASQSLDSLVVMVNGILEPLLGTKLGDNLDGFRDRFGKTLPSYDIPGLDYTTPDPTTPDLNITGPEPNLGGMIDALEDRLKTSGRPQNKSLLETVKRLNAFIFIAENLEELKKIIQAESTSEVLGRGSQQARIRLLEEGYETRILWFNLLAEREAEELSYEKLRKDFELRACPLMLLYQPSD